MAIIRVGQLSAIQNLAATTPIVPNAENLQISSDEELTLTATPAILNGVEGQGISITNIGGFTITLPHQGLNADSGLRLTAASLDLHPWQTIQFIYFPSGWVQTSFCAVVQA